ncbi:hypothetical protein LSH36_11g10013, partial [Paralvinella palmiformis]
MTIMLIKTMSVRHQHEAKQSFWVSLTSIIQYLIQSDDDQQSDAMEIDSYTSVLPLDVTCKDPVGLGWWYLLHVTPLYCYDNVGTFSQTQVIG